MPRTDPDPRVLEVLALFPGTTSFYPATVAKKPPGMNLGGLYNAGGLQRAKYGLRFDGDEKYSFARNIS